MVERKCPSCRKMLKLGMFRRIEALYGPLGPNGLSVECIQCEDERIRHSFRYSSDDFPGVDIDAIHRKRK